MSPQGITHFPKILLGPKNPRTKPHPCSRVPPHTPPGCCTHGCIFPYTSYPPRSNCPPHLHSSHADAFPTLLLIRRKINAKIQKLFDVSLLGFPFACTTAGPPAAGPAPPGILAVRGGHRAGVHKAPRLHQCRTWEQGCDLRLAAVAALASSHWDSGHWTWVTTRGWWPG